MTLESSSCVLGNPDTKDSQTPGVDADLQLTRLSGLWVPSTCRQKANESSQGHSLDSLNLASDVGSHEEWKASTVLNGRRLRLSGWQ